VRRALLAVVLGVAAALALAAMAAASGQQPRPRWDTRLLALVPFPGFPAHAYVHPNGRIYEGTFVNSGHRGPSRLRHDHGSQFMSDVFQAELRFLGIASSPAFVREPEGNGCAERFIRTLKEQLLWIEHFPTIEALRAALLAFRDRYNREWLIERHGHRSPAAARAAFAGEAAA
jgi:transposase InsO family protein